MSELAAAGGAAGRGGTRTVQAWRTLLSWFAFAFGIFWQIVKETPSLTEILSYVGFRHPLLSTSPAFKRLPVDSISDALPSETSAEIAFLGRLTVVLDLDETLVCAYETSSLPSVVRKQAVQAGLRCFELECISGEKDVEGKQKAKEILNYANKKKFVDVHEQGWKCIRKREGMLYDDERLIHYLNEGRPYYTFKWNTLCSIFAAAQPYDEQLLSVVLPLLRHLSQQKDVRPVLHERFHMPEWFKQHGIPVVDINK
ncbi:hypothetical protein HPP92_006761 [Vanilla planifolia]|uniref:FCP1 homology domain-containing protein n=1 Tax=Vanilla planifolia TaxID=51239 RepID=A0A835RGX2_VANPL|nr:hypothetical protein HPP92_006761 [Vanilla planifolia]